MKPRRIALLARSRGAVIIPVLAVGALLAGCAVTGPPSGPVPAVIYGVLYGHVTVPAGRSAASVQGRVYSDSADALAFGLTTGKLADFIITPLDANSNYNQQFLSGITQVIYITAFAQGQGTVGVVNSTDTAYAVRMRVDSLGGTLGHDSIAVNLTLP